MVSIIRTFQLWLLVFLTAAALSATLAVSSPGEATLRDSGIALAVQWPLLVLIALPHSLLNLLLSRLPTGGRGVAVAVTAMLATFAFLSFYVTSLVFYVDLGTVVTWDMFAVFFTNFRQVLPDLLDGYAAELMLLILLSTSIGLLFSRLHSQGEQPASIRAYVTGAAGLTLLSVACLPYALYAGERISVSPFPATVVSLRLAGRMLSPPAAEYGEPIDIPLERQISMAEYLSGASPARTPDTFIIMLEAISSDHIGFTGYWRKNITPNIDRIASESLFFPNTYGTSNHSNYSQTSFHSSQYARRRPRLDQFDVLNYPKVLLFDILPHVGYQTAFFSAQNEDWAGMKRFILTGSTVEHFYHSRTELGGTAGINTKLDARLVLQRAQQYLSRRDTGKPVFLYLNIQNSHFPYDLPADAERPYSPWETDHFDFRFFHYDRKYRETVRNKYDNALYYVDKQVGAFIDYLKANDLYHSSLIIITADHGEAFYEKGYPSHGTSLYEDQIRTFALFKLPHAARKGVRNDAICLIDINPSVLETLGLPPHPAFQGKPILAGPRDGYIFMTSQGLIEAEGVVDYPWKYIDSHVDGKRLINIETDPSERSDYSWRYPEKRRELETAVNSYIHNQMLYYMELSQEERDRYYPPQF